MPKRSSNDPKRYFNGDGKDINEAAFHIMKQATGEAEKEPDKTPAPKKTLSEKNAAAVSLGRLGGLKGGKARADKLTPEQRKEIAKKAAEKRWNPKE